MKQLYGIEPMVLRADALVVHEGNSIYIQSEYLL